MLLMEMPCTKRLCVEGLYAMTSILLPSVHWSLSLLDSCIPAIIGKTTSLCANLSITVEDNLTGITKKSLAKCMSFMSFHILFKIFVPNCYNLRPRLFLLLFLYSFPSLIYRPYYHHCNQ